jgi:hypothetical protein
VPLSQGKRIGNEPADVRADSLAPGQKRDTRNARLASDADAGLVRCDGCEALDARCPVSRSIWLTAWFAGEKAEVFGVRALWSKITRIRRSSVSG